MFDLRIIRKSHLSLPLKTVFDVLRKLCLLVEPTFISSRVLIPSAKHPAALPCLFLAESEGLFDLRIIRKSHLSLPLKTVFDVLRKLCLLVEPTFISSRVLIPSAKHPAALPCLFLAESEGLFDLRIIRKSHLSLPLKTVFDVLRKLCLLVEPTFISSRVLIPSAKHPAALPCLFLAESEGFEPSIQV